MEYIEKLGQNAKLAERSIRILGTGEKNNVLKLLAKKILESVDEIIFENKKDLENAKNNKMSNALIDRLTLTESRIEDIAKGVLEVASLKDPIGEVIGGGNLYNGLSVVKKRVPLGVIGIIFESRPNVTIDAASLCFKGGNVCILRGGSDAINTNICLTDIIRKSLLDAGLPADGVQLVTDTSREVATALMKLNKYVDVLIPRGGAGLIKSVVENASVPVIQTGSGVCHLYVDEMADLDMALEIADNSKTQRPSVCNAIETLLVHKNIAEKFLSRLKKIWENRVLIYGDSKTADYIKIEGIATDEDYAKEFNDYIITIKIVSSVNEAVEHISAFGTGHSECIVTESLDAAEYFLNTVDAAAVYLNASTRFTDGGQFGLGAEIGISNQKLHARGPMGLTELTSYKYLIRGYGQIRE